MTTVFVTNSESKISVITPFYNAESYLAECITSVLEQTYSNWELLLVNDQSTDKSNEIAIKYARQDKRIKLFQNTDKGLIQALRIAYKNSTGTYITRMDADDKMSRKRLELMHDQLNEKGLGFVSVGKVKYFSEGKLGDGYIKYEKWLNLLTEQESNFEDIYRECSIPSPNFMINRTDFEQIGGFEPDEYPEDYDLAFRMYEHKLKICSVNETTLFWRDHSNRSTRTQDHYQPLTFIPLKVKYFLKVDWNPNKTLILWGAGKKGKLIAQELILHNIKFTWITDNSKKIGKDIYNIKLSALSSDLSVDTQVILAISNPLEVRKIIKRLGAAKYYEFF